MIVVAVVWRLVDSFNRWHFLHGIVVYNVWGSVWRRHIRRPGPLRVNGFGEDRILFQSVGHSRRRRPGVHFHQRHFGALQHKYLFYISNRSNRNIIINGLRTQSPKECQHTHHHHHHHWSESRNRIGPRPNTQSVKTYAILIHIYCDEDNLQRRAIIASVRNPLSLLYN